QIRSIEAKAKTEQRALTPEEAQTVAQLKERMQRLYDEAFASSTKPKTDEADSTLSASKKTPAQEPESEQPPTLDGDKKGLDQPQESVLSPAAQHKLQRIEEQGIRIVKQLPDGTFETEGPDGRAFVKIDDDGTVHRTYPDHPKDEAQATARKTIVFQEASATIKKRDAQTKEVVDRVFASGKYKGPNGEPAIVVDKVILGAGGAAVQDYATHSQAQRTATTEDGVPKILNLAAGADPWQGRKELMGQTAAQLSKEDDGLMSKPRDYSHDPTGKFAETSDVATAIADTRARSGMTVYESKVRRVVPDDSNPPSKYRVEIEVPKLDAEGKPVIRDGKPEMELRSVYAKDVDVAMGPGPDRTLARDEVIDAEYEQRLKESGRLIYGDAATGHSFASGEKVLVSGGGATGAWGAHRAHQAGAEVDWVSPVRGKDAEQVKAKIKEAEEHIRQLREQIAKAGEGSDLSLLQTMLTEQEQTLEALLLNGPFRGANLPRNQNIVNNPNIHKHAKQIKKPNGIEGPLTEGEHAGKLKVTFEDGTVDYYDRVVVAHGQDATLPGGPYDILYGTDDNPGPLHEKFTDKDGQRVRLRPIVGTDEQGRPTLLGLETTDSNGQGGIRIVGAAAMMVMQGGGILLTKHMTPEDTELFNELMKQRMNDANRVSENSRGVNVAIEVWADTYRKLNQTKTDEPPGTPPS
ncbi:MAG: hypothetical protein NZ890_03835, partial [Myxococcota bacterium]|nr:hypothetical protein [Myxococcota bacterium]